MRILITGSTGKLGSALLEQLKDTPYEVRATSRSKPIDLGNFKWVYSDLLTGKGLEEAVRDIDVIIHAATSPIKNSEAVEVAGFREFLSKIQHVKHFIYPSIVGIDEIPFRGFPKEVSHPQGM